MLVDLILSTALSQEDYKRHWGSRDKQDLRAHSGKRRNQGLCQSMPWSSNNQSRTKIPPSSLQAVVTIGELLQHALIDWGLGIL